MEAQRPPHGTPAGFREIYGEHGERIFRFCYRLCGNWSDAEDLAQDVFILAFQNRDQFESRGAMTNWLYRIALNRWTRLRDQSGPEQVSLDGTEVPVPDPTPGRVQLIALDEALARLPDALFQAFLLVKMEGLKYREAAAVLGVPLGTVQGRVHDARLQLQYFMGEGGGAGVADEESEPGAAPERRPHRHSRPLRFGLFSAPGAGS